MTAPVEGLVESQKAALALQVALAQVGVKTIVAALKLWASVPPNRAAEVADQWMNQAVRMVMSRRAISRDLAVAYYRLARALRTGTTIPDPRNPIPRTVTMADLRAEFEAAVKAAQAASDDPHDVSEGTDPGTSSKPSTVTTKDRREVPDSTEIKVVNIDGLDKNGDAEEAALEKAAEQEIRTVLAALGTSSLTRAVNAIDDNEPAKQVDQERDEAHRKSGARQAAAAARIAQNGGRGTVTSLMERDKKVLGYVRVSTTGTPCGWCAMLISRGFVRKGDMYDSEFSATRISSKRAKSVKEGTAEVGDKYHDNCKCVAIPVYATSDVNESDLYKLNRDYAELWPKVTKGKSGKAALTAWRKYIRQTEKAADSDTGDAQVA